MTSGWRAVAAMFWLGVLWAAEDFPKPYSPPCVKREDVFEFTEKPSVKVVSEDRYEISFSVKANCDVTVGLLDENGTVVRHLGAGVLGGNAPAPFQKNSLRQTIYWNGKDDLDSYVKNPGSLKLKVMLGLKPEFDKLLLGNSPKNLSPWISGLVVGPDGAYVFSKAHSGAGAGTGGHVSCRKFDHDGNYAQSLIPPPANLPPEKLGGYGFIEYEPGVRAIQNVYAGLTIQERAHFFPGASGLVLNQPVLLGQKLFFFGSGRAGVNKIVASLYRIHTDGSGETKGIELPLGLDLAGGNIIRSAISPDGNWLYLVTGHSGGEGYDSASGRFGVSFQPAVWRVPLAGGDSAKIFGVEPKGTPGSDNRHFQDAAALDCDPASRLYVCDRGNNRIQVFSADGQYLKTIAVDRPGQVRIHPKSGAVYVMHQARVEGKSLSRLTKFTSFDAPVEEWHADKLGGQTFAVDSWSAKTRLWIGIDGNVQIYQEEGKTLVKVDDFQEDARKEEGGNSFGQWGGTGENADRVVCDPTRQQVYFFNHQVLFDLKTGTKLGHVSLRGVIDDIAFDKKGYMHCHFNPGFYEPGIGRLDPVRSGLDEWKRIVYGECPYDYGVEGNKDTWWKGILPVKDQPGAKFFQDGIGANMRGNLVEECNIYHIPKMEDEAKAFMEAGFKTSFAGQWAGEWSGGDRDPGGQDRYIKEMEKAGMQVYWIKRQPGIPLNGATVWTWDCNGELKQECAVNAGGLIMGVQMDEESCVYFVAKQNAMRNGRPFLAGRGGTLGNPGDKRGANPLLGTLMKTNGQKTRFILKHAPLPLDEEVPKRPADLEGDVWVEGMEWLYAGVSPMPPGCSCPTQRFHLDWYKRSFVPEAYRHSFGVLDTAGNLIMHLGNYGNYDSGFGAKSKIPVGGDHIALYMPRFISGTDNYLCFSDWGERLVVLKMAYEAEESVPIRTNLDSRNGLER